MFLLPLFSPSTECALPSTYWERKVSFEHFSLLSLWPWPYSSEWVKQPRRICALASLALAAISWYRSWGVSVPCSLTGFEAQWEAPSCPSLVRHYCTLVSTAGLGDRAPLLKELACGQRWGYVDTSHFQKNRQLKIGSLAVCAEHLSVCHRTEFREQCCGACRQAGRSPRL